MASGIQDSVTIIEIGYSRFGQRWGCGTQRLTGVPQCATPMAGCRISHTAGSPQTRRPTSGCRITLVAYRIHRVRAISIAAPEFKPERFT